MRNNPGEDFKVRSPERDLPSVIVFADWQMQIDLQRGIGQNACDIWSAQSACDSDSKSAAMAD